jgi:hypothetical protein
MCACQIHKGSLTPYCESHAPGVMPVVGQVHEAFSLGVFGGFGHSAFGGHWPKVLSEFQ